MNINLLYSSIAFFLLIPIVWALRRSILVISVLSISLFVVALPWFRLLLGGSLPDVTKEGYFEQYASLYLFSLGVFLVGIISPKLGYLRPNLIKKLKTSRLPDVYWRSALLIISITWIVRIFRASEYGILFSGTGDAKNIANQGYFFVIFLALMQVLALGAIAYIGIQLDSHRSIGIFLWVCELVWALISEGRREFVFMAGLILFIRLIGTPRPRFGTIFLLILLGYSFISFFTPLFLLARDHILTYSISFDAFTSVQKGFSDAVKEVVSNRGALDTATAQNLTERGDAGQFIKAIANAINRGFDFMYGEGLTSAFAWSVPSLLVAKPKYPVEQLIQSMLGMPIQDDAVSWAAVGFADFGLFGCFVYGLIFALLVNLCFRISGFGNNLLISIAGSIQACRIAYNFEADPLLAFAAIRELIILVIIYRLAKIIFNKRKEYFVF